MSKPVIINVQKYGDFDMPYTVVSMLAPEGMGKKVAFKIAEEAETMFSNTAMTDRIERYLQDQGFTSCTTTSAAVGGNL